MENTISAQEKRQSQKHSDNCEDICRLKIQKERMTKKNEVKSRRNCNGLQQTEPRLSARASRCRALWIDQRRLSLRPLSRKWWAESPTTTDRLYAPTEQLRKRGNVLRPNALRRCWIWMLQTVPFAFILSPSPSSRLHFSICFYLNRTSPLTFSSFYSVIMAI